MKKIIIIIGIITVFLLLLFWFFFSRSKSGNKPGSIPVMTVFPTSTVAPLFVTTTPAVSQMPQNSLEILRVDPPETNTIDLPPVITIEFTLNDIVNPKTFFYTVSPAVDTYIQTSGNIVTIFAKRIWEPGVTTIAISDSTAGAHGGKLQKPYVYKFKTAVPEDAPDTDGNL